MKDKGEQELIELLIIASEMNAECIRIEYKDREYFIDAESGNMGIGIARMRANEESSRRLIRTVNSFHKNRRKTINGSKCKFGINVEKYVNFGEDEYLIKFKKLS
jgi:hypothetical protein